MRLIKNYSKYYNSIWYVLRHLKTCVYNYLLIRKYPFLKPSDAFGEPVKKYHYQYVELVHMPIGWEIAFGKMFCDDLLEACKTDDVNPHDLRIIEMKEKWGRLRASVNQCTPNIQRVLDDYEQVSGNICWRCGKIDVPMTNFGWLVPECRKCYVENHNNNPLQYDDMMRGMSKEECRIPDYYTTHVFYKDSDQYVNHDLTWITNRLRGIYK